MLRRRLSAFLFPAVSATNAYAALLLLLLAALTPTARAQVVRSGAGADAADILAVVNQFRTDLGNPNNGNTPGSLGSGRREINWDGGGAAAASTFFATPMTTFNSGATPRGAVFTTPGSGFRSEERRVGKECR